MHFPFRVRVSDPNIIVIIVVVTLIHG